jgi:hypothetical protein
MVYIELIIYIVLTDTVKMVYIELIIYIVLTDM